MFDFIKNIFKEEKEDFTEVFEEINSDESFCIKCKYYHTCPYRANGDGCKFVNNIEFDRNKESILIVDDFKGLTDILIDDLKALEQEGKIDLSKYNILVFSGNMAAYEYITSNRRHNGLNVKFALLDITLGGSLIVEGKNTTYTGVDVFAEAYITDKNFRFLFFTGNNLNPYIKYNKELIEKFAKITQGNIDDHILFKTSVSSEDRREKIYKELFE
jgi:hypothetical protein